MTKHTPVRMEDFAIIPPVAGVVPGGPTSRPGGIPVRRPARLDWASSRPHRSAELTPKPRGDALALLLAYGSAITWREDLHLARFVPCLAHTSGFRRAPLAARRPTSRCSVARAIKLHRLERLQTAKSGHLITRSARSRIDCGIVIPSALAVFRLITSSNVVGCCTGRSAGLVPFAIRST